MHQGWNWNVESTQQYMLGLLHTRYLRWSTQGKLCADANASPKMGIVRSGCSGRRSPCISILHPDCQRRLTWALPCGVRSACVQWVVGIAAPRYTRGCVVPPLMANGEWRLFFERDFLGNGGVAPVSQQAAVGCARARPSASALGAWYLPLPRASGMEDGGARAAKFG
jgi:hypothetical protein